MRFKLAVGCLLASGLAACTALLGDFTVGAGNGGPDGSAVDGANDGPITVTDGAVEAAADGAADGGPDGSPDGAPPAPDGGFLNLFTFGSTNTSPPANMRVAYDGAGNLYILFAFSLANLDVLGTSLTPVGSFDIGLIKVDPAGNKLWVKSYGSAAYEYPGGLAVAPNGDVYISGSTEGTSIDFGGTAGTLTRQSSRYLGWIAKINGQDGTPVKAISIDGPGAHQGAACTALAIRPPRLVAMCQVYGPSIFPLLPAKTPTTFAPADANNAFVIADLDPNLDARWVNSFGSSGADFGASVAIAANNDTFFVATVFGAGGTFIDTKSTIGLPFAGATQMSVVARLSAATGTANWARNINGDAANSVVLNAVSVDSTGRAIVAGGLSGSISIGSKSVASVGGTDIFVGSFDGANGNVLDLKSYGGASLDEARAMTIDQFDSPSVVGTYQSPGLAVDGVPLPDPLATSNSGFTYRAAPNLKPFWVAGFTTGLAGTFLQGWSIASDPGSGRIAAAGTFKGVINFGDNKPVRSEADGGVYNVWVVQRRP